jgi:ABC-2 type transport system permease protein
MKSKTSYFKISTAVIRDDFRRFWVIPVLSFLGFFFTGIFYILMNIKDIGEYGGVYMTRFIDTLLSGAYPPYILNLLWVPVLSALLVFRYLHNSGHVMAVHSQPYTRPTLLNSHTVSCILFTAIPIILTGIILLIIATPCYYGQDYYPSQEDMVDVFTRVNVLKWMWESFLTSMFILAISIIGGMITGTPFHHALAALGFNAVVPMCTYMLILYFDTYLFGYVSPENMGNLISHMSPALNILESGYLSLAENVFYVVLTLILYVAAMLLYKKRKLERAAEGIVFDAFNVIITLIFGYLGMTVMGAAFYEMFDESLAITTFGYIAGAVLGMVIVRMIIMKTIKIFDKSTLKIVGLYLVIAVIFFAVLGFDLTGYEKRVPESADHVEIALGDDVLYRSLLSCDDKETVDAVRDLHKMIIENKDTCIENFYASGDDYEDTTYISLRYYNDTDDGNDDYNYKNIMEREYNVPVYLLLQSDEFKALTECKEIADDAASYLPAAGTIKYADIYSGSAYYSSNPYGYVTGPVDPDIDYRERVGETSQLSDSQQLASLAAAIEKDYHEMTYDDIKNAYDTPAMASIEFCYTVPSTGAVGNQTQSVSSISVDIKKEYRNTIEWLNANGFGNVISLNKNYFDFAIVVDVENGVYPEGIDSEYEIGNIPSSGSGYTVVTDPELISKMYVNSKSHAAFGPINEISTSEDDIYYVGFYRQYSNMSEIYEVDYDAFVEGAYCR